MLRSLTKMQVFVILRESSLPVFVFGPYQWDNVTSCQQVPGFWSIRWQTVDSCIHDPIPPRFLIKNRFSATSQPSPQPLDQALKVERRRRKRNHHHFWWRKANLGNFKSCSPNFTTIWGTSESNKEQFWDYHIHFTPDPNTTSVLRGPHNSEQKLDHLPFHPGVRLPGKLEHGKVLKARTPSEAAEVTGFRGVIRRARSLSAETAACVTPTMLCADAQPPQAAAVTVLLRGSSHELRSLRVANRNDYFL